MALMLVILIALLMGLHEPVPSPPSFTLLPPRFALQLTLLFVQHIISSEECISLAKTEFEKKILALSSGGETGMGRAPFCVCQVGS